VTRWSLFFPGLAAYLLGLIVTAPATLLDAGLKRVTNGKLGIAEARGTLWSGAGQAELSSADRQAGITKNVTWRIRPQFLLLGRFSWEVEVSESPGPFPVTISPSRIEIAGARLDLPAEVIGIAVPRLAPLELRGDLTLQVSRVSITGAAINGDASMQWRSASSELVPVAPLGDYELRMAGDGGAGQASLHTVQGPLQLDGSGSWSTGAAPVFLATARVPVPLRQQLAPMMRLIGVERGDGRFDLRLDKLL
jgi:general secretion pathway protein N